MAFDSITNQGEYISAHYLAALLKNDLEGLRSRWARAQHAGLPSSAQGVKGLGQTFFVRRSVITEGLEERTPAAQLVDLRIVDQIRDLNDLVLRAFGYTPADPSDDGWLRHAKLDVVHQDSHRQVPVALAVTGSAGLSLVALDATWAEDAEGIIDQGSVNAARLLEPIHLDGQDQIDHAGVAIDYLFSCEDPPRYVVLLAGNVVLLADRSAWPHSYLAVNLSQALHAKDDRAGGELETIAALFGVESLLSTDEQTSLAGLVELGRRHAVKVSKDLREALRQSVELIAQEILDRIRAQDGDPDDLGDDLAKRLTEQSLRYLYRLLFLLYAEARPDLGILPSRDESYKEGYGLARLGDIVTHDLPEESENGLYFYESLSLLFRLVDNGYSVQHPAEPVLDEQGQEIALGREGLQFEALKSDLFRPDRTSLIDARLRVGQSTVDTRLRNKCLWRVVNLLMLTREQRKGRRASTQRGFISYAQLGINQLGAVYEGLMSYTGFFAPEDVWEVAKTVKTSSRDATGGEKEKADPSKGTWIVPVNRQPEYDPKYYVTRVDPVTGDTKRVVHAKGSFVYRLSGRERQRSASYYTPEVLTTCTVRHALKELLTEQTTARDILDLTICEPALGSGAFLNEAINQLADEYLDRAQREQGVRLLPDQIDAEKQKVKAYLALHNCYGVDLNATAVELAEVSIWLNVMHKKLEAPWFGLHLRRGNSLIGARRATYQPSQLTNGAWRSTPATDRSSVCDDDNQPVDPLKSGEIHHFLLPAQGWGAVADAKEAKELGSDERTRLMTWRREIRKLPPGVVTARRFHALSQRVERLWALTRKRMAISEDEIRRDIEVWGVPEDRPLPKPASGAVSRDAIVDALYEDRESPYNRLKIVMDAWCALWFWPVGQGIDIDPPAPEEWLDFCEAVLGVEHQTLAKTASAKGRGGRAGTDDRLGLFGATEGFEALAEEDQMDRTIARCVTIDKLAIDPRFGWWSVLTDIADREGFFHWELEYAQIFARGGFDLQVGNPPWVRLDWKDEPVLAESEPWFMLQDRIPEAQLKSRRGELLEDLATRQRYLFDLSSWSGLSGHLGSAVEHSLLEGIRTNLYINFVERCWVNSQASGVVGLIHYEQHFVDPAAGQFREAVYKRLRRHFQFGNNLLLFEDVDNNKSYGINIYGASGDVDFVQLSRLVHPAIIDASLAYDGDAEVGVPGIQYPSGGWDTRPHSARVIRVTESTLADWAAFGGQSDAPILQARGLRPFTVKDNEAIGVIGRFDDRLTNHSFFWTSGLNEKIAKRNLISAWSDYPESAADIIMQGPFFSVATPYAKEPNPDCGSNKDYTDWDLVALPDCVTPRTNYTRSCSEDVFRISQQEWGGRPANSYFRVAWRRRVVAGTERTHQAALLPPGPTHVDTVHTLALGAARDTAIVAGVWASLPLDFICRVSGKEDIRIDLVQHFPAPLSHPLVRPLLLRALRLNCLTKDYAPLWGDLFDASWQKDRWTDPALERLPLQIVEPRWNMDSPLRTDYDRRLALVEIDALVALMLGLTAEQLCAMYRSQFSVLRKYEWEMFFAPDGHKIGAETHNRGVRQTDEEAAIVKAWKKAELTGADGPEIPEGWVKPNREAEMTHAYKEFQRRLDAGEYGAVPESTEP